MTSGVQRILVSICAAALGLFASLAAAETTPAQLQKYQEAVYPEGLLKGHRQGNVLLFGRIDKEGKIQDLKPLATSHEPFVEPAIAAVSAWVFKPATRDGKPIEIAANVAVRFRLKSDKRGAIPLPMLGDLAVFPADASGKKNAPEGFPIQRGVDPRLRAEALLDVPPQPKARKVAVRVEAASPSGRRLLLFEDSLAVPAGAAEVRVPFTSPIGADWEDGVWMLRFTADKLDAGGGQFWLAGDPARFDFPAALAKR